MSYPSSSANWRSNTIAFSVCYEALIFRIDTETKTAPTFICIKRRGEISGLPPTYLEKKCLWLLPWVHM
jgi:hypothetical protein